MDPFSDKQTSRSPRVGPPCDGFVTSLRFAAAEMAVSNCGHCASATIRPLEPRTTVRQASGVDGRSSRSSSAGVTGSRRPQQLGAHLNRTDLFRCDALVQRAVPRHQGHWPATRFFERCAPGSRGDQPRRRRSISRFAVVVCRPQSLRVAIGHPHDDRERGSGAMRQKEGDSLRLGAPGSLVGIERRGSAAARIDCRDPIRF